MQYLPPIRPCSAGWLCQWRYTVRDLSPVYLAIFLPIVRGSSMSGHNQPSVVPDVHNVAVLAD